MSKSEAAEAITPEVVEPADDETPSAVVEAEQVEQLVLSFDGADWRIPATMDELDVEAVVAFSELAAMDEAGVGGVLQFRHLDAFLRSLLGAQQYARLKRGRKARHMSDFFRAVMVRYGEAAQGE